MSSLRKQYMTTELPVMLLFSLHSFKNDEFQ